MPEFKLLSWNVNGIRSVAKKGFLNYLASQDPDIFCLQETKAQPEQLDQELLSPKGYLTFWNYPEEKKGYSGVAIFAKNKPKTVETGIGNKEFDSEGRILIAEYPQFTLCNVYFPKGDVHPPRRHRLEFKEAFYDAFLEYLDSQRAKGKNLIICGDFNTAHEEIDLARPKENSKESGFLTEERAKLDELIAHGFIDTFRQFNKEPNQYTWWDIKTGARQRNVGWRLDYFFVSDDLVKSVKQAFILDNVKEMIGADGSDHCPVGIVLKLR